LLIDAFARIAREHPHVELVVAGGRRLAVEHYDRPIVASSLVDASSAGLKAPAPRPASQHDHTSLASHPCQLRIGFTERPLKLRRASMI
jgi:hypothetical protein